MSISIYIQGKRGAENMHHLFVLTHEDRVAQAASQISIFALTFFQFGVSIKNS